jgi:hypothetical protein
LFLLSEVEGLGKWNIPPEREKEKKETATSTFMRLVRRHNQGVLFSQTFKTPQQHPSI